MRPITFSFDEQLLCCFIGLAASVSPDIPGPVPSATVAIFFWRAPGFVVNTRSSSALILRDPFDRHRFRAGGADQEFLQGTGFAPLSCIRCLRNACLYPRNNTVSIGPRNVVPTLPCCGGDIAVFLTCVHTNLLAEMERVMGIEPTLSAWEAEVLPLNYTRPCPRGEDAPTPRTGTVRHPRWERFLTDQSCDGSPSGSLHAFASEQSFHLLSRPLQSGIRFFHHPLPTASSVPLTSDLVWLDRPDAALGLPRSA